MRVNRRKWHIKVFSLMLTGMLIFVLSCVKEYWPKLEGASENLLVVDGKITNDPGPYIVTLSRSSSVQYPTFIPVSNATVIILDDIGNQEFLTETSSGVYETAENGIQGVVGRKYKLHIITESGQAYDSDFEELLDPVRLASVGYSEERQIVEANSNEEETGYQFYLTTEMAAAKNNYYFWELEETYEYHSAYNIRFYYNGTLLPPDENHPLGLQAVVDPDTLFFCWKSDNLNERFTYSTEYLSTPVLVEFPLHFIPFNDERLRVKYSVLIKQYTVSYKAQKFYKALVEQNSNQEGLITNQPYQIRGNMRNIKDPEEAVLGYFITAGVSDGPRVFVEAPSPYYHGCIYDTVTWHIQRYIDIADTEEWPLYFTYVYFENPDDPFGEELEALALMYNYCMDCTLKGGVAVMPWFWQ